MHTYRKQTKMGEIFKINNVKLFFELAQDFHLSAKTLFDTNLAYTFFSAGFLLKRGLECFFKACNLFCDPAIDPEKKDFKKHNLMEIAKKLDWLKLEEETEILIEYFNKLETLNYNYNVAALVTPHLLCVWDTIMKKVADQMPKELRETFEKLHFSSCDPKYQDEVLLRALIEAIKSGSNFSNSTLW